MFKALSQIKNQKVCVWSKSVHHFISSNKKNSFQKTILESIAEEDSNFKGDGYTSLAIIYAVMSLCNWAAPSVISTMGPKFAMFYGSITYM